MPSKNGISITAGKSKQECLDWRYTAVVVDVLRCSTTICALLESGKRDIRVYGDKDKAAAYKLSRPEAELFSELKDFPDFAKFDNSPFQALALSNPAKPAVIVTAAGTKTVMGFKNASRILIGCFANLGALASNLRAAGEPVLVAPASLFHVNHAEDFICADEICRTVNGGGDIAAALARLNSSGRVEEFLALRKETGRKDLELAFGVSKFKALPSVIIKGDYGEVVNLG